MHKGVLITGAAHGIGRQLALKLSTRTNLLILIDKSDDLTEVLKKCMINCPNVYSKIIDVTDEADIKEYLSSLNDLVYETDLIIASAGISELNLGSSSKLASENSLMATNYFGTVNILQYFADINKNQIRNSRVNLVSITSISRLVSTQNSGFYSASKAALKSYLDGLRLANYRSNIQVHEIVCGFVNTRMNLGKKHAQKLMISDTKAASIILKCIGRKRKRIHSVPKFRNIPWYVLSLLPMRWRDFLLNMVFRFLYK
jgi:dehydrogenase/reductase SDR family protein 7B